MNSSITILDAFRNKHIPDRYLNSSSQGVLDMFENQVCVYLKASHDAFGYIQKYEIEDEIRMALLDMIFEWIKTYSTEGTWSIVSHGTKAENPATRPIGSTQGVDHVTVLGVIFSSFEDSENFMGSFLVVQKLST